MKQFNSIFSRHFSTSQEAIQVCQGLANNDDFSVRIRTSKPNAIYIVCSCEGNPEMQDLPRKRNRTSERCHCDWRVILYKNFSVSPSRWEFRRGRSMVHNHKLGLNIYHATKQIQSDSSIHNLPSIRSMFPDLRLGSSDLSESHSPSSPNQSICYDTFHKPHSSLISSTDSYLPSFDSILLTPIDAHYK